jgi:hypothetical protein
VYHNDVATAGWQPAENILIGAAMTYYQILCSLAPLTIALATPAGVQAASDDNSEAFSVVSVLQDDEALARPHDVELQEHLAFVPGKGGSLAIIDVADPRNPRILWSKHDREGLFEAETVLPLGDYLLRGTCDFTSIDIRDPLHPAFLKTISDRLRINRINGMVKRGDYVFAASKTGWINVFDIRDLDAPRVFGSLCARETHGLGSPHDIDSFGDHIIVADPAGFGRRGLPGQVGVYRVADALTHELLPVESWRLDGLLKNHDLTGANRVQVSGQCAYVAGSRSDKPSNVVVVDISDPCSPKQLAALRFADTRGPNGLTVAGRIVFAAGGQTVEAIDISDPDGPHKLASYKCPRLFAAGRDSAHDLVYQDGYLYVTGQNDNTFGILKVLDERILSLADRAE